MMSPGARMLFASYMEIYVGRVVPVAMASLPEDSTSAMPTTGLMAVDGKYCQGCTRPSSLL